MDTEMFVKQLEQVYVEIQEEKRLAEDGRSKKTVSQLDFILVELAKMRRYLNPCTFRPYYPRGIADSWEYDDALGASLLNLAKAYHSLRPKTHTT